MAISRDSQGRNGWQHARLVSAALAQLDCPSNNLARGLGGLGLRVCHCHYRDHRDHMEKKMEHAIQHEIKTAAIYRFIGLMF